MIKGIENLKGEATSIVAQLMMAATQTAPKACGADKIISVCLTGTEKKALSDKMRVIATETNQGFFERDAANVDSSSCIVLVGVQDIPLALPSCGSCGFINCGAAKRSGSHCTFNITDLGIAVGSAVSVAASHHIDNRIMYSAGKAAVALGFLGNNVRVAYGIPLSIEAKSIFYDRAPGSVLV